MAKILKFNMIIFQSRIFTSLAVISSINNQRGENPYPLLDSNRIIKKIKTAQDSTIADLG